MQPAWGWRVLAIRFVIALSVVSVATASSFAYAYWFANEQINRAPVAAIPTGVLAHVDSTQPANYLIVGSDSRAFVTDDNSVAADHFGTPKDLPGNRADTIMIAHVDPQAPGKGFLVSIPRDTWVSITDHGHQKINAALNYGNGPATLINTIKSNFGVSINHYLKIDFVAFTDIVNAIGHVDIFFPAPAYDEKTGLYVKNPGCRALGGLQALAYARSRYYQYRAAGDGTNPKDWTEDQRSDLGRIARQQYFIRSLAQKAIKDGARSPLTARRILEKIVPHLERSKEVGLAQFLSLVRAFRSVNPGAVQMLTVPTVFQKVEGQDAQIVIHAQAQPIFTLLGSFTKQTQSTKPVPRAQITVQVLNGSGVKGIAGTTQQSLVQAGFANGPASADADNHAYQLTQVRYSAGHQQEAQQVKAYLGGVGVITPATTAQAAHVVVVTGADFTGVVTPGSHTATTTASPPPTTVFPNPGSTPGLKMPNFVGAEPVGCG
ncbi:MAG TPA: LCP family protein [Acidimicrobiia bacterium]|nr:LCP family protein [Acidimicrobiia bacterium]